MRETALQKMQKSGGQAALPDPELIGVDVSVQIEILSIRNQESTLASSGSGTVLSRSKASPKERWY
jgi:hypothetical protein